MTDRVLRDTRPNWSPRAGHHLGSYGIAARRCKMQPALCRSFLRGQRPGRRGYVASLPARAAIQPDLSLFEYSLSGKWLELLKQIAPGMTQAAVISNPLSDYVGNLLRSKQ